MLSARPEMLATVRAAKGWTQRDLAEYAKLTQSYISQVESGNQEMTGATLTRVAQVLDCPESLLASPMPESGSEITCLHHRRRSSTMTASNRKRVEALAHLTRITVAGLLDDIELRPQLPLTRPTAALADDVVSAARQLRTTWGIPAGPISNVTKLIEAAGIIVVKRDLNTAGQDAVSSWPAGDRSVPIIMIRSDVPADRWRFTLAHELGHLVMHAYADEGQEEQANLFASEFLAPAADIYPELANLQTGDMPRLLTLKQRWGLSVAALIRRAYTLEIISDRQYREFNIRLNRLNWRKVEPGVLPAEAPSTLRQVVTMRQRAGDTLEELAAAAKMTLATFARYFTDQPPRRLALDLEAP